jgi:hypothetical protein
MVPLVAEVADNDFTIPTLRIVALLLRQRIPAINLVPVGGDSTLLFCWVCCHLIITELRDRYVGGYS